MEVELTKAVVAEADGSSAAEEYKLMVVNDEDEDDALVDDQKVEKKKGCCFGFCFDGNTMAKGIATVSLLEMMSLVLLIQVEGANIIHFKAESHIL
jgi:hypothetical protein